MNDDNGANVGGVAGSEDVIPPNTWSYSHFMYRLQQTYTDLILDADKMLAMSTQDIIELLGSIMRTCKGLEDEMKSSQITLRPNKMFVHYIDTDYNFPDDYQFLSTLHQFIESGGIIVFHHMCNFNLIKKFLTLQMVKLSTCRHPITGDTIWHLCPFLIDMMDAQVNDVYNFRNESTSNRRCLATTLQLPPVQVFPLDVNNTWTMKTLIFAANHTPTHVREPSSLCRYIKKFRAL